MKTAFVTGGAGFLGLNIIEQLRQANVDVVALHRPSSNVERLKRFDVRLVQGTITSPDDVMAAMPEDCDAVFHVAGNTSLWSGDRDDQTRDNVDGTRHMIEAAIARGAKCFIHTSSISAFSRQEPPSYDEVSESTALRSSSNYERSKYLGELEVLKGVERGLRAVIMNPGSILGRYDTRSWARLIILADRGGLPGVPDGDGWFCDGEQVARAHIAAVEKGRSGERYILAGTDASLLEFVTVAGRHLGRKVPTKTTPLSLLRLVAWAGQLGSYFTRRAPTLTPEGVAIMARAKSSPSSAKAMRELGYQIKPLDEMMKTACTWLREEGLVGKNASS